MRKFAMHETVKDTITGFVGMVIGVTEWDNGCVRYIVQSRKLDKDGKPIESQTFDEQNLVSVKATPSSANASGARGGPSIHGEPHK